MFNRCPECGSNEIEFESGHPESFDEPGQADCWFCNCGWSKSVDFYDRLEAQADEKLDDFRDQNDSIF